MDDRQEEVDAQVCSLVSWMNAHHAKAEANHEEMMAARETSHERIEVLMDVGLEATGPCLQKAKETISVKSKYAAVHEEVRNEDAVEETGRALNKLHRDGDPAVGLRGKPKERNNGNGGSRKK
jgi:hypothetical protein